VPSYRIEVYWPGVTREDVNDLVGRALAATRRLDAGVTYVGCEVAPHDETVSLRVTAGDQTAVQAVAVRLDLPDVRITAVLDVPSPGASM
jgi:hypothetical protein